MQNSNVKTDVKSKLIVLAAVAAGSFGVEELLEPSASAAAAVEAVATMTATGDEADRAEVQLSSGELSRDLLELLFPVIPLMTAGVLFYPDARRAWRRRTQPPRYYT